MPNPLYLTVGISVVDPELIRVVERAIAAAESANTNTQTLLKESEFLIEFTRRVEDIYQQTVAHVDGTVLLVNTTSDEILQRTETAAAQITEDTRLVVEALQQEAQRQVDLVQTTATEHQQAITESLDAHGVIRDAVAADRVAVSELYRTTEAASQIVDAAFTSSQEAATNATSAKNANTSTQTALTEVREIKVAVTDMRNTAESHALNAAASALAAQTSASNALAYSNDANNRLTAVKQVQTEVTTLKTTTETAATNAGKAKDAALVSQNAAAASATAAATTKTQVDTLKSDVTTLKNQTTTAQADALASKNAAATSATNAASSAATAKTHADTALTRSNSASSSATAAETSATAAAKSASEAVWVQNQATDEQVIGFSDVLKWVNPLDVLNLLKKAGIQSKALASGADLNTIKHTGLYHWTTGVTNAPTEYASMLVTSWTGTSDSSESCEHIVFKNGVIWLRSKNNASSNWSTWRKIDVSTFMQGVLSSADAATARSNLGVAYSQSFGGNGYIKLPGGFILQWGQATFAYRNSSNWVTFPLAFPNASLHGWSNVKQQSDQSGLWISGFSENSKTGANFYGMYTNDGRDYWSSWFVLGY